MPSNAGLKGLFRETRIDDDLISRTTSIPVSEVLQRRDQAGREPALTALNMRLRDDYTGDWR